MKKTILLLLFVLAITSLQAQSLQKVIVVEYKGQKNKTPLANVEVVVSNAGSVVTDKNGQCVLRFRTLKPGDRVSVRRIYKSGYEIFNKTLIDQWVISRTDEPFVIELVESKLLSKIEEKYREPTQKAAERIFENQTKHIKTQLDNNLISEDEYNKMSDKLRQEYQDKLDDIDNYIQQFTHIDLSATTQSEKRIVELLKSGDIEGAIKEYEEQDLVGQYTKTFSQLTEIKNSIKKVGDAKVKADQARNQLSHSLQTQISLLQFAGGETNAKRAIELTYEFAKGDTTNYEMLLWAAESLYRSGRYAQAEELLQYGLNSGDSLRICEAKLYLGAIASGRSRHDQAFQYLSEAYDYFNRQARLSNDSLYLLSQRAMAIKNLFMVFAKTLNESSFEMYDKNSYEIVRQNYILNNTVANKRLFIEYLCHRGDIMLRLGALEKSEACIKEALSLQEELYNQDQRRQVAMLGYIYGRLAAIYVGNATPATNWDLAKEYFDKQLDCYSTAYNINPSVYARNYAYGLCNVGMFKVLTEKDYVDVPEQINKGLEIYFETIKTDASSTSSFPCTCWPYLAHSYTLNGDPEKAIAILDEHVGEILSWYDKSNNYFYVHTFRAYYYYARAYAKLNNIEKAREYIIKAHAISPSSTLVINYAAELGVKF